MGGGGEGSIRHRSNHFFAKTKKHNYLIYSETYLITCASCCWGFFSAHVLIAGAPAQNQQFMPMPCRGTAHNQQFMPSPTEALIWWTVGSKNLGSHKKAKKSAAWVGVQLSFCHRPNFITWNWPKFFSHSASSVSHVMTSYCVLVIF